MELSQPTASARERSYHTIRHATAAIDVIRPGTVETAALLLNEAKMSFERTVAESANLESKATTLLGIVATASGALGVFGTRDGKLVVATPLVTTAMSCVLLALLCALYILRAKRFDSFDIGSYISAAMVREDNRLGLSLALAETYRHMRDQTVRECRQEGRALFSAYAATAVASMLLLLGAINANPAGPPFAAGGPLRTGTPAATAKP